MEVTVNWPEGRQKKAMAINGIVEQNRDSCAVDILFLSQRPLRMATDKNEFLGELGYVLQF